MLPTPIVPEPPNSEQGQMTSGLNVQAGQTFSSESKRHSVSRVGPLLYQLPNLAGTLVLSTDCTDCTDCTRSTTSDFRFPGGGQHEAPQRPAPRLTVKVKVQESNLNHPRQESRWETNSKEFGKSPSPSNPPVPPIHSIAAILSSHPEQSLEL